MVLPGAGSLGNVVMLGILARGGCTGVQGTGKGIASRKYSWGERPAKHPQSGGRL